MSHATYKCVPFSDALKGSKKLEWKEKCEQALQDLKTHLGQPLLLSKLVEGETLYIYLVVLEKAVNAIAMMCHSNKSDLHYKGDPRGDLWESYRGTILSIKSTKTWVLLAYHEIRL